MKENEERKLARLESLQRMLDESPLAQQIIAEKTAEVLAKRMETEVKIDALKRKRVEVLPKLQADLEDKEAILQKARTALAKATDEWQTAKAALSRKKCSYDSAISHLEGYLIESADPRLDEASGWFRDKIDFLRQPGRISLIAGGSERNIFTLTKTVKEETNADAVHASIKYCQAAIKELERMKLTPELDKVKIEEMKKGVPSIDIYSEVTSEVSMPKAPPDFLQTHGHVLEKIDKLMKKVGL
jgi:hypothetical protein